VEPAVRVSVDNSRCAGHARCAAVDDELFVLDDDGYIAPGDIEVPAAKEELARKGVAGCPERALTLA
jgi:ferredoxin